MALVFDVQQASGKPDDNRRPGTACPFCDTEGLANIIRRDGDCIWLENKFKTLRATRQTVLIESADHDADLNAIIHQLFYLKRYRPDSILVKTMLLFSCKRFTAQF